MAELVLFVGPGRSGTTWLYENLKAQSVFSVPRSKKEIAYFNNHWEKGDRWFLNHFDFKPNHRYFGEFSTHYFASETVVDRVRQLFPDAKIMITLRSPVERMISVVQYQLRAGVIKSDSDLSKVITDFAFLKPFLYYQNSQNWVDGFGERVKLLDYNLLKVAPEKYWEEVTEHIGPGFKNKDLVIGPVNQTVEYRSKILSLTVNKIRMGLHDRGLNQIVTFMKNSRVVRNIIFRPTNDPGLIANKAELTANLKNALKQSEALELLIKDVTHLKQFSPEFEAYIRELKDI